MDYFQKLFSAGMDLKTGLMLIAGIFAVCACIGAGLLYFFGRDGAQKGKAWLVNIIIGVSLIAGAMAIITTVFAFFGTTPHGLR